MEENLELNHFSEAEIISFIDFLIPFVSEERKSKFDAIIEKRMKTISVVLEDVFQSHNTSAILRTCDLFGIQNVHFIENRNAYRIAEDVALGASQWLNITRHHPIDKESSTVSCLKKLKNNGYKIVATTPHENGYTPENLPIDSPIALVLGTEKNGISEEVKAQTDYFLRIPMYGFTESFNVSVSAAVCLYPISERIRNSGLEFGFNEHEKKRIYTEWLLSSLPKSNLLIKEFKKNNKFVN